MAGQLATSREQIFEELWNRLSNAQFASPIMGHSTWVGKARKYVDPAQIPPDMQPFLSQYEGYPEKYGYQKGGATNLPPIRIVGVRLWCWARADSGDPAQLGSQYLTTMLEAVEQALIFDTASFVCTLNGLVIRCRIEGTILKIPGDVDGQALLCVPILMLWPN